MRFFPQSPGLIIAVQILHGICYAFFFATVYIFVDEHFPKDVRSSAQGLFNVMILGVGALVANSICPKLIQQTFTNKLTGITDFKGLFLVPLACGFGGGDCPRAVFPSAQAEGERTGGRGRDGTLRSYRRKTSATETDKPGTAAR